MCYWRQVLGLITRKNSRTDAKVVEFRRLFGKQEYREKHKSTPESYVWADLKGVMPRKQ